MSEAARLLIHIDGAARGNPGPAAFAYVIAREGHPVFEHAECMGEATNNVAEYTALVRALERGRVGWPTCACQERQRTARQADERRLPGQE